MSRDRVQPSRLLGRRIECRNSTGSSAMLLPVPVRSSFCGGTRASARARYCVIYGSGRRLARPHSRRRRVGDGDGLQRPPSALRTDPGSPRPAARTAAGSPRHSVRPQYRSRAGPVPGGLATLTLLADVAEQQPLVCIIDDAQCWTAPRRRFSVSSPAGSSLSGSRLCAQHAPAAVTTFLPGCLRCRSTGSATARPAPCCWTTCTAHSMRRSATRSSQRATAIRLHSLSCRAAGERQISLAGSGCPTANRGQQDRTKLRPAPPAASLPDAAAGPRRAAEPLGDPLLLHRAAETLGVDMAAADPAVDAGLLRVGGHVEFAHPLVRSAAYRSAAAEDRHRIHRALAEATDPETDPDRRAWHRARAMPGPSEEVAAELERSAGRAQARGESPRRPRSCNAPWP
jgi:hypothetical protein